MDLHQVYLLVTGSDVALYQIVSLSLGISLSAVFFSALLALPFAASLVVFTFPGKKFLIILVNTFMGLPPVVVGLMVYLMLSRAGPLGNFGILFTPQAMVIAQIILIFPIIAALARQTIEDLWEDYSEQLTSLGASKWLAVKTLIWDAKFSLLTALLAGLGRALSEVGAVIIVGGNIEGVTRVMTTAIALETSKGELTLAISLGVILILVILLLNMIIYILKEYARI